VEEPKIGGIVGIGVQIDRLRDETQQLVMDSVLSTLLNVVGSVRAIYKYTHDLEYYATRDPLTDLYNQRMFWELIGYEIDRSRRHNDKFCLLVIDLDNFKTINDSCGHAFGDHFLEQFARALQGALRAGDILARYGGDEFVAILSETGGEDGREVAQRVLDAASVLELAAPSGAMVKATVSIGMAVFPDHAADEKDLFLFADNMMYKAKRAGKGNVAVPTEEDVVDVFRSLSEKSLIVLNAVEERHIVPYFQPIIASREGGYAAVEVLSRINLPDGMMLGAGEFVEIAEKMGVIHKIDYIVMEKALAAVKEHGFPGLVFVNLSPRAFLVSEFGAEVRRIVDNCGLAPGRIVFEITERETVKNLGILETFLNDLKRSGFRLAIDDFGSGFSSFHYLRRFPVDFVKIEGEFIANMLHDERDRIFVRSITGLARDLGMKVVAEYVEDAEVLELVAETGIHLAQGYHIGKPMPQLPEGTHPGCVAKPAEMEA
jgi:diguanylate cyclase (GGDEF)-like protein